MFDRAEIIDGNFEAMVKSLAQDHSSVDGASLALSPETLVDVFDTQLMSRHLDFMARRSKGKTFYSIGSAGHEGMAALALATRPTDMAFLHYRDAAFLIQRMKQVPGETPLYNMALSFAAAAADPVSGGRHKVLGGLRVNVPPQTSTIASHLPKAVGAAHSIGLAAKVKIPNPVLQPDGVIIASFGDASANHSTAQGAINTAAWASYQGAPMPLVFVCEDNGIGISVPTPGGWIANSFSHRAGLTYVACDSCDVGEAASIMQNGVRFCRIHRKPVFIHTRTVRLMGHAGADIEATYESLTHIEETEARDPLLATAKTLIDRDILTVEEICGRYRQMADRVARVSQIAMGKPKLTRNDSVMAPLVPKPIARRGGNNPTHPLPSKAVRTATLPRDALDGHKPITLSRSINFALAESLLRYKHCVVFGEDVGRKGGVYGVTGGLQKAFGRARVFDTLLDEQSILGQAIGMAHNGFVPIPEIQFLAYLHNAEDQIRGEAATLSFFSNGQFTNPMVIRIAGLAYQKGFGGHFHNDNSFAVLRDIPGLILACPAHAGEAPGMLRECIRLAHEERRVVVFLEPIALYNTQDLHNDGDGEWMHPYSAHGGTIALGAIDYHDEKRDPKQKKLDLAIITYGNGYFLARQAAHYLARDKGYCTRVINLRWLHPLPAEAIRAATGSARTILVVDECRQTGSLSEQIISDYMMRGEKRPVARLCADDSFIPLGPAAYTVLPSRDQIIARARALLEQGATT
ncbi:MAG: thiamine pyrophosphate-dependent enzyme [Pseudomonadota bacterium]